MTDNSAARLSTCISFLCDQTYLFPTLVAAKQASAHAAGLADIVIVLSGSSLSADQLALYEKVSGAKIQSLPTHLNALIDNSIPPDFFKTHVNRAALYRLFIGDVVGEPYDTIMYMDGDLLIRGCLADVLKLQLQPGEVGAVPDWVAHHSTPDTRFFEGNRAYLTKLQMEPQFWGSYFNSGVMIASRSTWRDIGQAAFQFLIKNPSACRLHDQSALNYACQGRVRPLPIRYNFIRQYMYHPAYKQVDPAVLHFVGKLKPWHGVFKPWGQAEYQPYVDLYSQLPAGALVWRKKPLLQTLAYKLKTAFASGDYTDKAYRDLIGQIILERNEWRLEAVDSRDVHGGGRSIFRPPSELSKPRALALQEADGLHRADRLSARQGPSPTLGGATDVSAAGRKGG
jgi:lipopolysaccharide biosynthesis glycosyltransferase